MPTFKTKDYTQILSQMWKQVNPQQKQYIHKQQFKQFAKLTFNNTQIGKTVKDKIDDKMINVWLKQYLSQKHNLEEANVKDVQFKYNQALDFFDWLVEISQESAENEDQNQQEQKNGQENKQKAQNEINIQQDSLDKVQKMKSLALQNQKIIDNQIDLKQSYTKNKQHQTLKQQNQFNPDSNQHQDVPKSNSITKKEQDNQIPNDQNKTKQDFSLNELQAKYKEHLQIIFQHYCKLTYATENDPTFQQIQHKTTIMTLNKFMIFSKQFQIPQILPKMSNPGSKKLNTRTYLIQTFKKHAQCYKQMSFDQFCEALWKISEASFSQLKKLQDPNDIKQSQTLNYQKIRMLQYMQISFFRQFKEKMKKLNINYVMKTNTNNQNKQKKAPFNYKFKFQPANHPSSKNIDMIAQHISALQQQRRHLKSERKQMLQERKNKMPHDLNIKPDSNIPRNKAHSKIQNFQRSSSHKNYTHSNNNIFSEKRLVVKNSPQDIGNQNKKEKISNSDNLFAQKKLGPLLPPKKISKNTNSSSPHIPNGITGYAKIHMVKKGALTNQQQSQTPMSGSRNLSKDGKAYRLNSIVEQAKNIVNYQQQHESYKDNTSSSRDGLYSHPISRQRYQSGPENSVKSRIKSYGNDLRLEQQLSNIQKNLSGVSSGKNQLKGLIDLNDSDEDQFLQQHLKKEKQKKNQIGHRIDKKISSLNSYK